VSVKRDTLARNTTMTETTGRREKTPNGHSFNGRQHTDAERPPAVVAPGFLVGVSKRFLLLSLLACVLVAFAIGRTARMVLLIHPQVEALMQSMEPVAQNNNNVMKLPNPVLKNGKQPPPTLYTSKNFDTARSAAIYSRWVVTEEGSAHDSNYELPSTEQECQAGGEDPSSECSSCRGGGSKSTSGDGNEEGEGGDDEMHLPAGQHLLMDIRNVDASFLASEERLANAMLDVVGDCGLTLLSYHCHGLHPAGVSCVGVLLESHVSFHTWPAEGVITLDLFTCGASSLLPIVSRMEDLFSVPRPGASHLKDMPETMWAYKIRGFAGEENQETTAELTDLFTFPIGVMTDYKKQVKCCAAVASQFTISECVETF
jgi:S-adenosylmethionine decarboxylase proenzyme